MAFSIFKDGEIGGAEYKNVRDDLEIQDFRDWINSTTEQYLPYCGDNLTHLRNIASDNFQGSCGNFLCLNSCNLVDWS
jgi:hypothetical protein